MSTEQATLAKGTRVEITDVDHRFCGLQAEIIDDKSRQDFPRKIRVAIEHEGTAFPEQFKVLPQPEPTIGQLVDAMHQEIERICESKTWVVHAVDTLFWPYRGIAKVSVGFDEIDRILTTGSTPQAALRAMIERLREVK